MSVWARMGIVCLMGLAIVVARLVEVELQSGSGETLVIRPEGAAAADPLTPQADPLALGLQGSQDRGSDPRPAVKPQRTYEVQQGDTFGKISQKVYGASRHWKRLHEANTKVVADPRKLRPGMVLIVPNLGD